MQPLLPLHDLPGKVRYGEDLTLSWAGVVKGAGPDDPQSIAPEILIAQEVLRHLAHGVGALRTKGLALPNRKFLRIDKAVLLTRAGDVDQGVAPHLPGRFKEVKGPQDVRRQGFLGGVPGGRDIALGRQMKDAVRLHGLHHTQDRGLVPHIPLDERQPLVEMT